MAVAGTCRENELAIMVQNLFLFGSNDSFLQGSGLGATLHSLKHACIFQALIHAECIGLHLTWRLWFANGPTFLGIVNLLYLDPVST